MGIGDRHSLYIDEASRKTLKPEIVDGLLKFFDKAETAIESEDIDGLMGLYSENYINGEHRADTAKATWERLFRNFDNLATVHNMRILTYSAGKNIIIIQCSGMLLGVPKGKDARVTLDSWVNEDHVLSLEEGNWKLIGTSGEKRKRFWFDKPMHPLF